jgi:membrane protease YdiL (CAAX protease family)
MYSLLLVVFSLPVISSILIIADIRHPGPATSGEIIRQIAYELIGLGLLALVLRLQHRKLSCIGFSLSPSLSDIGNSILLFFGAYFVTAVTYGLITILYVQFAGHPPAVWNKQSILFGETAPIATLLLAFLNPFFEEMLVRGFLITEVAEEFGNSTLAIILSVGLQSSYHLYQGIPSAVALSSSFLLFSLYFVRTRRLLPVVLAHLYLDVFALLNYVHSPG